MKKGYCHFCKESDAELHKKSHILPSFLFKNIYGDEGKRLIEVDPDNLDIKSSHSDSPYEKWIFCKKCEMKHSALESKAAYLLNEIKIEKTNVATFKGKEIQQNIFKNIDIDVIKKFWILNLFRADLSERSLYEMVSLGPYAEKFRLILHDELSVDQANLNIHIFVLKHLMKDLSRLSSPIFKKKVGSKTAYMILIDGVAYLLHFGKPDVELLEKTYYDFNGNGRINIPNRRSGKIILEMFNFKKEWIKSLP